MTERTRVLIVDDSRIFRSVLEQALRDEGADVVGSVWSGAKALEFIEAAPPDLVTLDVEMPGMNGLDVLRAIQRFNAARPNAPPIGVLMVSAFTRQGADVTIQALESGAFDFITKPSGGSEEESLRLLRLQVASKLRSFQSRRTSSFSPLPRGEGSRVKGESEIVRPYARTQGPPIKLVLIASSTGGPRALSIVLPDLCRRIDLPIFIVQHMATPFTQSLAASLDRQCGHKVIEAIDGDTVRPGTVYIAPGGKHLVLRGSAGNIITSLNEQPPENGCRPAADVLFRSAAAIPDATAVAVVLTGMMCDGTRGLGPLKRAGAHVIAQDEATSVVWGMPGSAVASGLVDEVLPLEQIAAAIGAAITSRKAR
jgi:two-component system chemotaxis response regulator CheB